MRVLGLQSRLLSCIYGDEKDGKEGVEVVVQWASWALGGVCGGVFGDVFVAVCLCGFVGGVGVERGDGDGDEDG